ncbi:TPA: hypothetical protein JAJ39_000367 [Legionella pneumophila]|nr:hypothetical protein [Legionella pneumophila]
MAIHGLKTDSSMFMPLNAKALAGYAQTHLKATSAPIFCQPLMTPMSYQSLNEGIPISLLFTCMLNLIVLVLIQDLELYLVLV